MNLLLQFLGDIACLCALALALGLAGTLVIHRLDLRAAGKHQSPRISRPNCQLPGSPGATG